MKWGGKMKIDMINFKDDSVIWKQIEKRDGLTFMRIRKSKKGVVLR